MHPLYDTSELTDDQIMEKIGKAYTYRAYQESLGRNDTVHSINQTIMRLEEERQTRFQKMISDDQVKKIKGRDNIPDPMAPIELGTVDTAEWDKRYEDRE